MDGRQEVVAISDEGTFPLLRYVHHPSPSHPPHPITHPRLLFVEEKAMPSREEREAKIARRACRSLDTTSTSSTPPPQQHSQSSPAPGGSSRRRDRPAKVRGLTKQTYSAYVTVESGGVARKWHLTVSLRSFVRLSVRLFDMRTTC